MSKLDPIPKVPGPLAADGSTPTAWHHLQAEEVFELLGVTLKTGLAADEVSRRQKEFGPN